MLHSLRIYLSIPEVFFIFFEEAVVAVVNMQLASRFLLHKAQVFEVWSFNVIFSQSRKRTNFPPTVQTTFDQRSKYNWPTRAFAKRKLEKEQIPNGHFIPTSPDSNLKSCWKLTFGEKRNKFYITLKLSKIMQSQERSTSKCLENGWNPKVCKFPPKN